MNDRTGQSTSFTTADVKMDAGHNLKQPAHLGSVVASSKPKGNAVGIQSHLEEMQKSENRIQSQMRLIEAQSYSQNNNKTGKRLAGQMAGQGQGSLPQLNLRKSGSKPKSLKKLKFLSKEQVVRDQNRT